MLAIMVKVVRAAINDFFQSTVDLRKEQNPLKHIALISIGTEQQHWCNRGTEFAPK